MKLKQKYQIIILQDGYASQVLLAGLDKKTAEEKKKEYAKEKINVVIEKL